MLNLKVTRERLINHLHYGKWTYIAAAALAMVVWNFAFSATAPQTPAEYKLDIYILAQASNYETWEDEILAQMPEDQQEVNFYMFSMTDAGASAYDVIGAWMTAGQGDIFIMSKEVYLNLASQGVFIPLDTPLAQGQNALLDSVPIPEGYDLETLRVEYEMYDKKTGESSQASAICGVPLDDVKGLLDLYVIPEGMVASVTVYSANQQNAVNALAWIINNKRASVYESSGPG
jgi:hypothetical protein